jgi:hypothetical protein
MSARRARWATALLCASAARADAQTVRDSAGVRIVLNPARATAPAIYAVATQPSISVGGLEGDPRYEFNHRNGYLRAVRLSNGGLAVIDDFRVHFFDATGARRVVRGALGSGPGEFRQITSVCAMRGDTVVVYDVRLRRVGVFDANGGVVRQFTLRDGGYLPFSSCFDDGFLTVHSTGSTAELKRLSAAGSVMNTFPELFWTGYDMATNKDMSVAAGGVRLYYGTGDAPEWHVYSGSGSLEMIVRTVDVLKPLPVERPVAGQRAFPARLPTQPAYRAFLVDPSDRLWVEDYAGTGLRGWTVFTPSGLLLGRLVLPKLRPDERMYVLGFGKDEILVKRIDADGASFIEAYPLIAAGKH